MNNIPMTTPVTAGDAPTISVAAARVAIGAAALVPVLLAALHVLSPEFDPSWRVVSEYAHGNYAWVLSLMFIAWALSSWALAFTIRSQLTTTAGKVGLVLLVVAGLGEAMASVFDIDHPLHGLAGMLGVLGLPIAAMLISASLGRTAAWSVARRVLLWTANLTWMILALMIAALVTMMVGYTRAGNKMTPDVIALVGWPNRMLVVLFCVWVMTVAYHAIRLRDRRSVVQSSRTR